MNIAKFLMSIDNQYNGHFQTETKGMSLEQGMEICKELEELFDNKYSFVLELWTCGGFTINQKDYFPNGTVGGRDRIILSNGN